MARRLSLIAVLALAAGMTPAAAFHSDDLPFVAGQSGLPAGWRSFAITTDGSEYAFDIEAAGLSGAAQAGAFFYREDNTFAGGFGFTVFPGKDGVLLRINPPAGDPIEHDTMTSTGGGGFGVGLSFNVPPAQPFVGTHKLVMWWSGAASDWSWEFRALPGTGIDSSLAGDSAYLVASDEFASVAHAQAYSDGVGARASVTADYPLAVTDTLIGFYQMGATSAGTLSVTSPRGEQDCGALGLVPVAMPMAAGGICLFAYMEGENQNGPGDYVFHTTSAGAGFTGAFDDVWFGGADARLP